MIEWSRVNELRKEVGAEDFDEVVDLFLEEVEEVIERLRAASDPASLEGELHFLKGSALNLGFRYFSELCQIGETRSARGEASHVDVGEIIASYETSKSVFQAEAATQLTP